MDKTNDLVLTSGREEVNEIENKTNKKQKINEKKAGSFKRSIKSLASLTTTKSKREKTHQDETAIIIDLAHIKR